MGICLQTTVCTDSRRPRGHNRLPVSGRRHGNAGTSLAVHTACRALCRLSGAAATPAESPRITVVFRLRQCDKENHGWREGPPLTVCANRSIRWRGLHPPVKITSNEKRILLPNIRRQTCSLQHWPVIIAISESETAWCAVGKLNGRGALLCPAGLEMVNTAPVHPSDPDWGPTIAERNSPVVGSQFVLAGGWNVQVPLRSP